MKGNVECNFYRRIYVCRYVPYKVLCDVIFVNHVYSIPSYK